MTDRERYDQARRYRADQIAVLEACACEWPIVRVRNMVGHPESCPAYAVWMRIHRPPAEGTR